MNTNRYSFDDRFGDDLFELIISYLPIEDKLKYESVSKRFQRFVFNKQRVLRVIGKDSSDCLNIKGVVCSHAINLSKILKKFVFITTIEFNKCFGDSTEVLKTIGDNCLHLTSIHIDLYGVHSKTLNEFFKKFGQQLRHISIKDYQNEKVITTLFHYSPNLLSISGLGIRYRNNLIVLPKKVVKIESYVLNSELILEWLSDNKSLHLKHLEIEIQMKSKPNINCFKELSHLKSLEVLKIRFYGYKDSNTDIRLKIIQSFATNCLNLQYLSIEFKTWMYFNAKQYLEIIGQSSRLKKLSLIVKNACNLSKSNISDLIPLKNCKNLLVLNLRLNNIENKIFDGIHLIVPQLKQLSFNSQFEMTDKALESMAKLNHLTHLEIYGYRNVYFTFEGIEKLITGCKRFKSLHIFGLISDEDKFEELKAQHKQIDFRFNPI